MAHPFMARAAWPRRWGIPTATIGRPTKTAPLQFGPPVFREKDLCCKNTSLLDARADNPACLCFTQERRCIELEPCGTIVDEECQSNMQARSKMDANRPSGAIDRADRILSPKCHSYATPAFPLTPAIRPSGKRATEKSAQPVPDLHDMKFPWHGEETGRDDCLKQTWTIGNRFLRFFR
jgi:hypothetical protein